MTPSIQIAIPTYNRWNKLLAQLNKLQPQLTNKDKIVVIDNASSDFDSQHAIFADPRIRVIRNLANLGLCANISACFHHLDCDWLWLLSDDDRIFDHSLATIRDKIAQTDAQILNFSSALLSTRRRQDLEYNSAKSYFEAMDSFSNHLLLSNNVYHSEVVKESIIKIGYGISMGAPHMIPIMLAINKHRKGLFCKEDIIKWQDLAIDHSWNRIPLFNLLCLIDFLDDYQDKKYIFTILKGYLPKLHFFSAQLSHSVNFHGASLDNAIFFYRKIGVYYCFYGTLYDKYVCRLNDLLTHFPRIAYPLYTLLFKIVKKASLNTLMQNRKLEFYI